MSKTRQTLPTKKDFKVYYLDQSVQTESLGIPRCRCEDGQEVTVNKPQLPSPHHHETRDTHEAISPSIRISNQPRRVFSGPERLPRHIQRESRRVISDSEYPFSRATKRVVSSGVMPTLPPSCDESDEEDEESEDFSSNSPPRPIPALHGPLSLPYARCPSGAEGTVIKNDDPSHMLWGLNQSRAHVSRCAPQAAPTSNDPVNHSRGGNGNEGSLRQYDSGSFPPGHSGTPQTTRLHPHASIQLPYEQVAYWNTPPIMSETRPYTNPSTQFQRTRPSSIYGSGNVSISRERTPGGCSSPQRDAQVTDMLRNIELGEPQLVLQHQANIMPDTSRDIQPTHTCFGHASKAFQKSGALGPSYMRVDRERMGETGIKLQPNARKRQQGSNEDKENDAGSSVGYGSKMSTRRSKGF